MTKEELLSTAKPILFNTDMVRAILSGQKTVTRRLPSKSLREKCAEYMEYAFDKRAGFADIGVYAQMPTAKEYYENHKPYAVRQVLYVRETWQKDKIEDNHKNGYIYKADYEPDSLISDGSIDYDLYSDFPACIKWKPSIHMPKEAARIFLKVTSVRMERLQEIMCDPPGPHNQVVLEGCTYGCDFIATWNHTIPKKDVAIYGWDANPLVWVIEFERLEVET